jgi:gliding motility-associated-like protein
MRYILQVLLAGILSFFTVTDSFATHIYGGDLTYAWISGNTYSIKLTLYGDCAGDAYPGLRVSSPQIRTFRNNSPAGVLMLTLDTTTIKEVTPVCKAEANNTTCKGGTVPGIVRYEYSTTYTLNTTSNRWRFVFEGTMGNGQQAGRSTSVTNLSASGIMYLEAVLNNTTGNNTSPEFTSVPTPFFCVNQNQEYNQGAIDNDNDSLYFSLTAAISNGTPMSYRTGYSATKPLSVVSNTFKFDNQTGQMTFMPDIGQSSVVVNKIEEYRNGVLIGSTMREMSFIVFSDCNNTPPSLQINKDSVYGAGIDGTTLYSCMGTRAVSFIVEPVDKNGDNITLAASNLPLNASFNVTNNSTKKPRAIFYWDTQALQLGTYTMYVNMKDDGCPLSSNQTQAIALNIVEPFKVSTEVLFPTRCYNRQYTAINVNAGIAKKKIVVTKGGHPWSEYADSSTNTVIRDSFTVGEYEITVSSAYLPCSTTIKMNVVDSGAYPIPAFIRDKNLCVNDPVEDIDNISLDNLPINRYTLDGTLVDSKTGYNTNAPGTYSWIIKQQVGACESVADTFKVIVHALPQVKNLTKGGTVCLGDTIELKATGADYYEWLPKYRVKKRNDTSYYARVMEPDLYTVIGKTLDGCVNTDSFRISSTEDCCTFSYPSAFTPNGDGLNDGFKPVLYGNQGEYLFAVYNRWGQQVFITSNPRQYWDGTFNSQKCDVGVYYYKFRATCLTGHIEIKSGEVMLIR